MRIFDITIYRDGGSIEFKVEKEAKVTHVWLDTPFRGEPRALCLDSVAVSKGAPEATQLLDDIERWWRTLHPDSQRKALEALLHKGAFRNPDEETKRAADQSRILRVRDYVRKQYLA